MRFFKAFNLHRRTKSATFVPGSVGPPLAFASIHSKSTSLSTNESKGVSIPPLFDLIGPNPSVPLTAVTDLSAEQDHTVSIWNFRRPDGRSSINSLPNAKLPQLNSLDSSLKSMSRELSLVYGFLHNCQQELVAERETTKVLELKIAQDAREMQELRGALSRYVQLVQDLKEPTAQGSSHPSEPLAPQVSSIPGFATVKINRAFGSQASMDIPRKHCTADEYSAALRMTLATRKELREQRKVTKFWKNVASNLQEAQDIITPSSSAISSIRHVLPVDRQAAVNALIARRGILVNRNQSEKDAAIYASSSQDAFQSAAARMVALPSNPSSLISSSSHSSATSRLMPLASESLKVEMNLHFGILEDSSILSSKNKRRSYPLRLNASPSASSTQKSSMIPRVQSSSRMSLNVESFGDINIMFENGLSGDDNGMKKANFQPPAGSQDSPTTASMSEQIPLASCIIDISLPTGNSQVLLDYQSQVQPEAHDPGTTRLSDGMSSQQGSKSRKAYGSWQRYISKHYAANRSSQGKGTPTLPKQNTFKKPAGKENNIFSVSFPIARKKVSRLPVPTFGKYAA
ncbi:unnamed protein product [Cyclocybe aegerita]|uniref:Uncharacterized protein n=1 Tax=Cyclocybe aegerita TaxID=1973307 RepID=A0A8S0WQ36_CYCAE|nr:unnamed protein product [Cyclocybe aegerita]